MKKDVIINISSKHKQEGETDRSEFLTEGHLYRKDDKYYLVYNNPIEEFEKRSVTTVKFNEEDNITLMRSGETNYQLSLKNQKRSAGQFGLGMSQTLVGTYADRVRFKMNDNGGWLDLKYSMDNNASTFVESEIKMKISEQFKQ